ncbi:protein tyrosine phosphatase receptor type C-associated protein [Aegotheles albertisi]
MGGAGGLREQFEGARWCPAALLALAGVVAGGDPVGTRSDRAVGALLGVLLCLALGLAAAWHHLCRLSAGRYHPRPLGRRALARLRGHWHRLRGHGDSEGTAGDTEVAAEVAVTPWEEEELMPWSRERREEEDEDEDEDEEGDTEADVTKADVTDANVTEARPSDLHPFSGTAAWGDTRPHVTAL